MPRIRSLICSLILALTAMPLAAMEVEDLARALVPVADQSRAERETGIRSAMGRVLVKLSGDRKVAARESVKPLIKAASGYVQQFRYESRPGDIPGEETWLLDVQFDEATLRRELKQRNESVWSKTRPAIMLWLAIDDRDRRLLSESDQLASAVEASAASRGLPVVLPLMDLSDHSALGFSDVWGEFGDRMQNASRRYGADMVLAGKMRQDGKRWVVDWKMLNGGQDSWTTQSNEQWRALSQGVHDTADRLVAKFVAPAEGGSEERLVIGVSGVTGLEGYIGLTRYLESLGPVQSVSPLSIHGDRVRLAVKLRGSQAALRQLIGLGRTLVPAVADEASALVADMSYRLGY